jgi:hypothetical protein
VAKVKDTPVDLNSMLGEANAMGAAVRMSHQMPYVEKVPEKRSPQPRSLWSSSAQPLPSPFAATNLQDPLEVEDQEDDPNEEDDTSCQLCQGKDDAETMLLCDVCDKGYQGYGCDKGYQSYGLLRTFIYQSPTGTLDLSPLHRKEGNSFLVST